MQRGVVTRSKQIDKSSGPDSILLLNLLNRLRVFKKLRENLRKHQLNHKNGGGSSAFEHRNMNENKALFMQVVHK